MSGPLSFVIQKARIEELEKQVLGRNAEIEELKLMEEVLWKNIDKCKATFDEKDAKIARLEEELKLACEVLWSAGKATMGEERLLYWADLQTRRSVARELLKEAELHLKIYTFDLCAHTRSKINAFLTQKGEQS